MTWPSISQKLPAHLERFADQLSNLSLEVRNSVAGLAGDAVGRAVRDVLLSNWQSSGHLLRQPERSGWNHHDEWENEDEDWEQLPDIPVDSESSLVGSTPKLALALQAVGWFLEHGTLTGLLGTGLSVGGLALLRRHLKSSQSEVIRSVADVASLLMLLGSGAKSLRSR